ncbi:MAG: ABC transporter permease subunit [Dehalococcoidia bacterium]|nr:ABC transporter permease subunit [Dehalococcoidia bacterium]
MMATQTITTTAALTSSVETRSTTFMRTLASEWVKLTTPRSTYITLGLGTVLSIAMSALVCLAVGSTFDSWSVERQAQFAPILLSMTGVVVLLIVTSVFGVLVASGEYASGMMRLTLTATPRRTRVLAAKLVLVSGITLALGLVTAVAMFWAGQAVLASYGITVADLGDADAQRFVLGLGAVTPLFPILGLALGFILRSSSGAITAVLGLLWLSQIFGELVPSWPQEHVLSLFPQSAADSLTGGHLVDNPIYTDPPVAAAILLAWLVALVGVAYVALTRRDA